MNFTSPKNYLFMLPEMITLEEQNEVVQVARGLLTEGYVYVFSAHETSVEDRDHIRFLPLRTENMPSFGEVSGVLVARDRQLAQRVKEVYPGAPVMVFDPGQPMEAASSGVPERASSTSTIRTTAGKPQANIAMEPLLQAA